MPSVLLYEFLTSGGLFARPDLGAEPSLVREGLAMLSAAAADFAAIEDVRLHVMVDGRGCRPRLPRGASTLVRSAAEEQDLLWRLASEVDWTVLIAPEIDNLLLQRAQWIEQAGGRLLGPASGFISIAADKHRTASRLQEAGVPTPWSCATDRSTPLPPDIVFPAVVKPRDGAGSLGVRLVANRSEAIEHLQTLDRPTMIQPLIAGQAASVAVLCGPRRHLPLPACSQRLTTDGQLRYLGGSCPLPGPLDERARQLALRAVAAMPPAVGYIGVDLVLGEDSASAGDHVIEINPRLTTSYVGLRAALPENLAAAMLAVATGQPRRLSPPLQKIEFDADGAVRAV